jgi:hypothetical protein
MPTPAEPHPLVPSNHRIRIPCPQKKPKYNQPTKQHRRKSTTPSPHLLSCCQKRNLSSLNDQSEPIPTSPATPFLSLLPSRKSKVQSEGGVLKVEVEVERTFRACVTKHSRSLRSDRLFLDKPSGTVIISASVSVLRFNSDSRLKPQISEGFRGKNEGLRLGY